MSLLIKARVLLGRLGFFWMLIPVGVVAAVGVGTCSLIDVPDIDRFEIEASVPDRRGVRSAVVVRYRHLDSGNTVKCVWIVPGSGFEPGPTRRLAEACVIVAADPQMRIELAWQANGRLAATLPAGTGIRSGESAGGLCLDEAGRYPRHACVSHGAVDASVAVK